MRERIFFFNKTFNFKFHSFHTFSIGVEKIYVNIRSKRNVSASDRLEKILNSDLFDKLREIDPNVCKRIHLLNGSLDQNNIGLTNEIDLNELIENCEIVIHSAANVEFNDPMENYIRVNILGTENLLQICKQMKKLKLFVYVSTAYSQSNHKSKIEETFYDPIIQPNAFMKMLEQNKEDFLKFVENDLPKYLGKHHIYYTLSKNSAEALVKQYENDFSVIVVRPAISE